MRTFGGDEPGSTAPNYDCNVVVPILFPTLTKPGER